MKKFFFMRTKKGARICFYMAFATTVIVTVVAFACLYIAIQIDETINVKSSEFFSISNINENEYEISIFGHSKTLTGQAVTGVETAMSYMPNEVYIAYEVAKQSIIGLVKVFDG